MGRSKAGRRWTKRTTISPKRRKQYWVAPWMSSPEAVGIVSVLEKQLVLTQPREWVERELEKLLQALVHSEETTTATAIIDPHSSHSPPNDHRKEHTSRLTARASQVQHGPDTLLVWMCEQWTGLEMHIIQRAKESNASSNSAKNARRYRERKRDTRSKPIVGLNGTAKESNG